LVTISATFNYADPCSEHLMIVVRLSKLKYYNRYRHESRCIHLSVGKVTGTKSVTRAWAGKVGSIISPCGLTSCTFRIPHKLRIFPPLAPHLPRVFTFLEELRLPVVNAGLQGYAAIPPVLAYHLITMSVTRRSPRLPQSERSESYTGPS
jgi:hypothetical protein